MVKPDHTPAASPTPDPLNFAQGIMVVRTDLEGNFTYANRAYLEYMGLQTLPKGTSALQHVGPADLPTILEAVQQVLEQPSQTRWVEFSKPLGNRWNRSRWEFMALLDHQGKPTGLQCIGYDISHSYRQARFQEASLELLAWGLREMPTPERVLEQALQAALRVVPAAQAGSAILLQAEGYFRFVAAHGYDLAALQKVRLYPHEPFSLSQHIQARVFTQADIAHFNSRLDPERRALLEGPGHARAIQATLACPVVVNGTARAYLYLDHFDHPDIFDGLDLRHLEGLAHHVAWLLYGNELRGQAHRSRYYDPQTGLPNLYSLTEVLNNRPPAPRALVALHCRSLERIRRIEGEEVWVATLQLIARTAEAELRSDDRLVYAKDTFWLLLEGVDCPSDLKAALSRLQDAVKSKLVPHFPQLDFNPRVGVVIAQPGTPPHELLQAAETALERTQQPGQVSFYEPSLTENTREDHLLRQTLYQALRPMKSGKAPLDFCLHFQPVCHLSSRRMRHLEALLRWRHPEQGLISAAKLLPIIEEEGWMVELGDWIIGEAVACAARWQVPIAVNLSASQLVPQLPPKISAQLQRHGLPPQALILEVTEQVVLNEASLSVLRQLALQGHPLHLDDFGSGFSSLERITALPLAAIKLGLGFMRSLGLSPNPESPGARLLRAVLALGKGLSLEVIVEGIETEAQLEFLLREGFSYGQGYLLGRPAAIEHDERLETLGQGRSGGGL